MKTERVSVPYAGGSMEFEIPGNQYLGTIYPRKVSPLSKPNTAIKEAIQEPISCNPLQKTISKRDKIALIACDITRNARDDLTVPLLLDELNKIGVTDSQITVVVATGTHRPNTRKEWIKIYGEEVVNRVQIVNHDAYDEDSLTYLGSTPSRGIPVKLNNTVVEADFRLATGVIEPHPFAGYSGGRKTMTIGTAGEETIAATHNVEVMSHPKTQFGSVEGNIFREFLKESADFVDVDFILNVILNHKKELLHVVAGDPDGAHHQGVEFARKVYEVPVREKASIVISAPGMPKELNLYQATRTAYPPLLNPKPSIEEGGVVIVPACCKDGIGHQGWYEWMKGVKNPDEIIKKAKKEGVKPGEHKAFFIGMLLSTKFSCSKKIHIIVVGAEIDRDIMKQLCLIPASTPEEALEKANEITNGGKVFVLPYGMITIPYYKG